MWRFAILEIYSSGDEFPSEGTPAEWIDEGKVSWCQSSAKVMSWTIPLYAFLWWKFTHLLGEIKDFFEFTVWARLMPPSRE